MENRTTIVTNFNGEHLVDGDEVYVYGSPVLTDGPVKVSVINGNYLGIEGLRKDNGGVDRLYFSRHTGHCPPYGADQLFLGKPTISTEKVPPLLPVADFSDLKVGDPVYIKGSEHFADGYAEVTEDSRWADDARCKVKGRNSAYPSYDACWIMDAAGKVAGLEDHRTLFHSKHEAEEYQRALENQDTITTITGPTTFTREVIKRTPPTFANLYDGSVEESEPWWVHHSTLEQAEDGRGGSVHLNPSFVATVELPGKIQEYRQQIDGETGKVVDEEVVG